MSLRLFVGVELAADLRTALAQRLQMPSLHLLAPPGMRFLPADNWHLTLQFLGTVAEQQVPAVVEACGRAARAIPSFAIELASASAFPSPRRARSLFIEVTRGHDELAQLAYCLHEATAPLGFEPDERTFRGHLTFARCKPNAAAQPLLTALAGQPGLEQPVERLTLFRSHLSSIRGAHYESIEHWPLGG